MQANAISMQNHSKPTRPPMRDQGNGKANGNAMAMQRLSNGNALAKQWQFNGVTMGMQRQCNGNAMAMLSACDCHDIAILLPRYGRAMAMI